MKAFWTDKSGQTVQTQIRLLLGEQSDQGLHCLLFHLHLFDKISKRLGTLLEFKAKFFGIQKFRNFTVGDAPVGQDNPTLLNDREGCSFISHTDIAIGMSRENRESKTHNVVFSVSGLLSLFFCLHHLSCVARKPVFWVSNQV